MMTEPTVPAAADAALLRLVQLLSPAFPTGAFAYSQGLEWAVQAGAVRDGAAVRDWLAAALRDGAGRADAILLAHALRADADAAALSDLALALAPSRERWTETQELGRAFARTAGALPGVSGAGRPGTGGPVADPPEPVTQPEPIALPVAVGLAARPLGLPAQTVVMLYLQGWAGALVQAAVRMVPLGQTEGQQILAALAVPIAAVAEAALTAPLDSISSATPGADLAGMLHETLDVRLYKT